MAAVTLKIHITWARVWKYICGVLFLYGFLNVCASVIVAGNLFQCGISRLRKTRVAMVVLNFFPFYFGSEIHGNIFTAIPSGISNSVPR